MCKSKQSIDPHTHLYLMFYTRMTLWFVHISIEEERKIKETTKRKNVLRMF